MWTPGQKPSTGGGAGGVDGRCQEGGVKMMFPPSVPNSPWLSRDDSWGGSGSGKPLVNFKED